MDRTGEWRACAAVGTAFVGAVGLTIVAGRRAVDGASMGGVFALFWLGMALFAVPALWRLLTRRAARAETYLIVALAGVLSEVPKLAISPRGPVYSDEIYHWRQTLDLAATGHLGAPHRLLPVLEDYSGLHGLVASFAQLTGLPAWYLAVGMLVVAKVVLLAGIVVLARALGGDLRVGAIAAAIYATGPNIMFFDSQFAYESLAIVCFVWAFCALAMLAREPGRGWAAAGLLAGAGCLVTHHVTSVALLGVALLAALAAGVRRLRGAATSRGDRAVLVWAAAYAAMWAGWSIPRLDRLTEYLGRLSLSGLLGVGKLLDPILGSSSGEDSTRELFAGSSAPAWARALAFVAPPIVAGTFAVAAWRRRRLAASPVWAAAAGLGATYVAGLALILTPAGEEIGHRALGFAFVGISVVVAPWLSDLLDGGSRRAATLRAVAPLALAAVFVGNVSGASLPEAMFPGPTRYGVDSRSANPESRALAAWLRRTQGPKANIVTDRNLTLVVLRYADASLPPVRVSFWELYFRSGRPEDYVLGPLAQDGFRLVAVDDRMYRDVPLTGDYLLPEEPTNDITKRPIDRAALAKFTEAPWSSRVFATAGYSVYRIDPGALDVCAALPVPPGFGAGCPIEAGA